MAPIKGFFSEQASLSAGALCMVGSVAGDAEEYRGCLPIADLIGKTNAQVKAALLPLLKADRDRKRAAEAFVAGVTGSGTV